MKGVKIALMLVGAASIAFGAGRLSEYISRENNFVFPIRGKGFYFFGKYPWHGDHDDYIGDLHGTILGIYDSTEGYAEIDQLNDMFYGEEN